jgi:hypothetical protein
MQPEEMFRVMHSLNILGICNYACNFMYWQLGLFGNLDSWDITSRSNSECSLRNIQN